MITMCNNTIVMRGLQSTGKTCLQQGRHPYKDVLTLSVNMETRTLKHAYIAFVDMEIMAWSIKVTKSHNR